MTPASKNLRIKTNGTYRATWQINSNGVPVDLTGYTFKMTIRLDSGLDGAIAGEADVTINEPANQGKVIVEIPPMPAIESPVNAYYDLLASIGGKDYVWIEGRIKLEPGATYG